MSRATTTRKDLPGLRPDVRSADVVVPVSCATTIRKDLLERLRALPEAAGVQGGSIHCEAAAAIEALEVALRRHRAVFGFVIDELGFDPTESMVLTEIKRADGKHILALVSLAEYFEEVDRLVPQEQAP